MPADQQAHRNARQVQQPGGQHEAHRVGDGIGSVRQLGTVGVTDELTIYGDLWVVPE